MTVIEGCDHAGSTTISSVLLKFDLTMKLCRNSLQTTRLSQGYEVARALAKSMFESLERSCSVLFGIRSFAEKRFEPRVIQNTFCCLDNQTCWQGTKFALEPDLKLAASFQLFK